MQTRDFKIINLFNFGSGLPGKKKTTSPDGGFMGSFKWGQWPQFTARHEK